MSSEIKVSVIMPVYNGEKYLSETLQAILNQTYRDMEIICVDDGSTDNTPKFLQQMSKTDPRIRIITQTNSGPGAARNRGFAESKGEYILFFDSDDIPSPDLVEKALAKLEETGADIVGFTYIKLYEDGSVGTPIGIRSDVLARQTDTFNYKDYPDSLLNVFTPVPWSKMYRADFIRNHNLKFEEVIGSDDLTFTAVAMANAEKITFVSDVLVKYRYFNTGLHAQSEKYIKHIVQAVESSVKQIKALDHYNEIKRSVQRFCVENYIFSLKNYTDNFHSEVTRDFYNFIQKQFNSDDYIDADQTFYDILKLWFAIIKKHDYDHFLPLYDRKIIISLSSDPNHIQNVSSVLETIFNQTRLPDKIVLWLGIQQYPNQRDDIPEELITLNAEDKLDIEFCENLQAHNNYYYAFIKYPDDLIITIGDDLLYNKDMVEKLFLSSIVYPEAVSTMNADLMLIDEEGIPLPYSDWFKNTNICVRAPSLQLCPLSDAGTIYSPKLFKGDCFDKQIIENLCPSSNDIWLKFAEIYSDIPVVLVQKNNYLQFISSASDKNSDEKVTVNRDELENQLALSCNWYMSNFGISVKEKILGYQGKNWLTIKDIIEVQKQEKTKEKENNRALNIEIQRINESLQRAYKDRKETEARRAETNDRLQKAMNEISRINESLQRAYKDKEETEARRADTNDRLQKAMKEISRINERLQQSFEERKRIEKAKNDLSLQLEKSNTEVSRLHYKLDEAVRLRDESETKYKYLLEELDLANNEIDRIHKKLDDALEIEAAYLKEIEKINNASDQSQDIERSLE